MEKPLEGRSFWTVIREDLRRGDLKRTLRRDLIDTYEYYLNDDARARLARHGRYVRWLYLLGWFAKSLFYNLVPVRRLLLILALAFFLVGKFELYIGEFGLDLDLDGVGFLFLLVLLLLELRDKLVAREELATGRAVQVALLPREVPPVPGWDIHFYSRPANDVGGDLVDYLPLPNGRTALILGDVAGKGLGAALLMAKLQATFRAIAADTLSLTELGARMNAIFLRDQVPGRYATLVHLELTPGSGIVRLLNAGHVPPVVLTREGSRTMEPASPPIGLFPDAVYVGQRIEIEPDESLLLFSDGITEAKSAAGEFFGEERLQQLLPSLREGIARTSAETVLAEVERFVGDEGVADDLSLIVLRRLS